MRLLLIQQALHRLVLEDELILGVEWQCKDVSVNCTTMRRMDGARFDILSSLSNDLSCAPGRGKAHTLARLDFGLIARNTVPL